MSPSVSGAESPLFFKIHGPREPASRRLPGAMNVLMERFSRGFRAFPPIFSMYFPTHFERLFCIFVHEKLQLRVRVEGVI